MSYGVGTKNPFDLLENEDEQPEPTEEVVPAVKSQSRGGKSGNAASERGSGRGGRGGGRGGHQRDHGQVQVEVEEKNGARDHDRHQSRTGRGKEVKKGGHGRYAFGRAEDAEEQLEAPAIAAAETAADAAPEVVDAPAPVEEEDKSVSYSEFLAKRGQVQADLEMKAREVVISKEFNKGTAIVREKDESFLAPELEEKEEKAKREKKKKGTVSLDEFFVANGGLNQESENRRGGRGASRGGARGGRGGRGGFAAAEAAAPVAEASEDAPAAGSDAPAPRGGRGGRGRGGAPRGDGESRRGGFDGESRGRGGRGGRGRGGAPRGDGESRGRGGARGGRGGAPRGDGEFRGRGGRGGPRDGAGASRGRGAPRGARGGARGNAEAKPSLNINDTNDFPSLGK